MAVEKAATQHEYLVRKLRELARAGAPETRLPGDRELARRFRVSNITLRDAMLVLAEQGWVTRRRGSGTYIMDRSGCRHVGILNAADLLHDDTSSSMRQLMRLLREAFEELGNPVRLYLGRDTPWGDHDRVECPEFHEAVAAERLSGLVVVGTEPDAHWLEPLRAVGVPVVFAGNYRDRTPWCVIPDHRQLARDAVAALLRQGRHRIGLLQWLHPRPGGQPTPDPMWEGFCEALTEADLTPNPAWTRKDLHPGWRGAGWSEFREIWAGSPVKPNGLIISDDVLFADAAEAITQLDIRVPEQLLVVAQTHALTPTRPPFPLIAMEFDPRLATRAVAGALDLLMRGERPAQTARLIPFRRRFLGFPEPGNRHTFSLEPNLECLDKST